VLCSHRSPTLLHRGSKWTHHFPDPRQVNIRCPQDHGWSSRTVSLVGSGVIHNASACHIATQELRTLPVLNKTAEQPLDTPQRFLPDRVPAVEGRKLAKIEAAMSSETSGLDFKERLATPRQSFDVDTLLHVHQKSVHAAQESHWLRLITIVACSVTVILLLFSLLRAYLQLLWIRCWRVKTDPTPIAAPRGTTVPDAMLEHEGGGTRSQGPQDPVLFTTYALKAEQRWYCYEDQCTCWLSNSPGTSDWALCIIVQLVYMYIYITICLFRRPWVVNIPCLVMLSGMNGVKKFCRIFGLKRGRCSDHGRLASAHVLTTMTLA